VLSRLLLFHTVKQITERVTPGAFEGIERRERGERQLESLLVSVPTRPTSRFGSELRPIDLIQLLGECLMHSSSNIRFSATKIVFLLWIRLVSV
jgi:hypothetical protein